jgi:hypothetical protein
MTFKSQADDVHMPVTFRRNINQEPPLVPHNPAQNDKVAKIFKLPRLCHISTRVEAYNAQTGLTQCHNCQQFGHVWANCRQPPSCLLCGGAHRHKECPEKGIAASTPVYCNCRLAEGEKAHPANYRGSKHVKEELQKRQTERLSKTTTGTVFSSNFTIPDVPFVAALQGSTE